MRLMSASPHNDEINEIWVQISKLLPSFTNFEQLMFLAYSFDLIDILKLQEPSSFKPVILETKLPAPLPPDITVFAKVGLAVVA